MTTVEPAVHGSTKPPIALRPDDYHRLGALAEAARKTMPGLADELAEELGRARLLPEGERNEDFVGMNNEVEFRDDESGNVRKIRLVYPEEADIALGKISVMTPVGTALIGLPKGESMAWETPGGDVRRLTVLSIKA
jgi:regulator of nucleoside diphosphate kinase